MFLLYATAQIDPLQVNEETPTAGYTALSGPSSTGRSPEQHIDFRPSCVIPVKTIINCNGQKRDNSGQEWRQDIDLSSIGSDDLLERVRNSGNPRKYQEEQLRVEDLQNRPTYEQLREKFLEEEKFKRSLAFLSNEYIKQERIKRWLELRQLIQQAPLTLEFKRLQREMTRLRKSMASDLL